MYYLIPSNIPRTWLHCVRFLLCSPDIPRVWQRNLSFHCTLSLRPALVKTIVVYNITHIVCPTRIIIIIIAGFRNTKVGWRSTIDRKIRTHCAV